MFLHICSKIASTLDERIAVSKAHFFGEKENPTRSFGPGALGSGSGSVTDSEVPGGNHLPPPWFDVVKMEAELHTQENTGEVRKF